MADLTGWFPPEVKPTRDGEYEVRDICGYRRIHRALWSRAAWRIADSWCQSIYNDQNLEWRGLTAPAAGVSETQGGSRE